MDWLPLIRVTIAVAVLCLASYSDWRTRMASDAYWIAMGLVGLALLGWQIWDSGNDPLYLLFLFVVGWFFIDLLWDREGKEGALWRYMPLAMYAVLLVCMGVLIWKFMDQAYLYELITIPAMFLLYFILYLFDVIKGGADAKALMALSLLIPTYPVIGPFPLVALPTFEAQFIMPFSLLILFYGALMTLVIPVYYLIVNLVKGDRLFPAMLFGIRMDLADAKKRFVWPMEYVDGDEIKISSMPKGPESIEEHYASLEAKGLQRIWVTPKIPMLIPITAGIVLAAFIGNVIFILF